MHRPVVIDGRNIFEAIEMNRPGFIYRAMGRGSDLTPVVEPTGMESAIA